MVPLHLGALTPLHPEGPCYCSVSLTLPLHLQGFAPIALEKECWLAKASFDRSTHHEAETRTGVSPFLFLFIKTKRGNCDDRPPLQDGAGSHSGRCPKLFFTSALLCCFAFFCLLICLATPAVQSCIALCSRPARHAYTLHISTPPAVVGAPHLQLSLNQAALQ